MSTRSTSGIKTAFAQGWQPYHIHVPIMKSWSLNLLETSGPVIGLYRIALFLFIYIYIYIHTYINRRILTIAYNNSHEDHMPGDNITRIIFNYNSLRVWKYYAKEQNITKLAFINWRMLEENAKFSVRHNIFFLSEVQVTCFGLTN